MKKGKLFFRVKNLHFIFFFVIIARLCAQMLDGIEFMEIQMNGWEGFLCIIGIVVPKDLGFYIQAFRCHKYSKND